MSVELVDGTTIINFVEDKEAFADSVRHRFSQLDTDQDGLLSYGEMVKEFQSLRVWKKDFGIDMATDPNEIAKLYASLFAQFDQDCDGEVSLEEYMAETKKMMLCMATGIGFMPIMMVLEEDSLLIRAVQVERDSSSSV